MAATLRARSLRHLRIRGRNDSGEENVSLDLSRDLPSPLSRYWMQDVRNAQHFVKTTENYDHPDISASGSGGRKEENGLEELKIIF